MPSSTKNLRGGVRYHDGQFDDARLLIALLQTAVDQGASVVNYARVVHLDKNAAGRVNSCIFVDEETGTEHSVSAKCFINATGPFSDAVRRMDQAAAPERLAASQGIHIVLPRRFWPGEEALLIPETSDGRVLFAIPWHGKALVGTTDTPIPRAELEPSPLPEEIDYVLATVAEYLQEYPTRDDVLSVFAGVRPLMKSDAQSTAKTSREHGIDVSNSGLVSIIGGKWTTYRQMAEDCVAAAAKSAALPLRECVTKTLRLHGAPHGEDVGPLSPASGERGQPIPTFDAWNVYGADLAQLQALAAESPELAAPLCEGTDVTGAQVAWAARHEMARTVEDVLSRRTRLLLLDAKAAVAAAPTAAQILASELDRDDDWVRRQVDEFTKLAAGYLP